MPHIFRNNVKSRAKEAFAVLASMNDEVLIGKTLCYRGFSWAVQEGLLTDFSRQEAGRVDRCGGVAEARARRQGFKSRADKGKAGELYGTNAPLPLKTLGYLLECHSCNAADCAETRLDRAFDLMPETGIWNYKNLLTFKSLGDFKRQKGEMVHPERFERPTLRFVV